jgi:hypothetical protein
MAIMPVVQSDEESSRLLLSAGPLRIKTVNMPVWGSAMGSRSMLSGTFEPLCPDEGYTEMELNLAFGGSLPVTSTVDWLKGIAVCITFVLLGSGKVRRKHMILSLKTCSFPGASAKDDGHSSQQIV